MIITIVALSFFAVAAPFATLLAVWWLRNWDAVRLAETVAPDDARKRLP